MWPARSMLRSSTWKGPLSSTRSTASTQPPWRPIWRSGGLRDPQAQLTALNGRLGRLCKKQQALVCGTADKELALENAFFELQTLVYDSQVVADQGQSHVYKLENPRGSEDAIMEAMPLAEHTKFSLARCLERRHGWDKRTLQAQPKAELLAHFPGEAPDAGRGRGRGRGAAPGKGRGRGRGKGRGRG